MVPPVPLDMLFCLSAPMEVEILGYSNSNDKLLINIGLPGQSHFEENIGSVYMLRVSCKGLFVNSERDGGQ
jgi:hypothetical protein